MLLARMMVSIRRAAAHSPRVKWNLVFMLQRYNPEKGVVKKVGVFFVNRRLLIEK